MAFQMTCLHKFKILLEFIMRRYYNLSNFFLNSQPKLSLVHICATSVLLVPSTQTTYALLYDGTS